jgi:pimeloyl-ACP methyl ester carboxylesterase
MMSSTLLLALALGADPTPEAVELKTDTGTLHGVLDLPAGAGPWPVVFIHPGSGPTDRDGNNTQLKNDSLKLLGAALRDAGFACLRIDKRGIAASAKAMVKEEDLRLTTYADDVTAWVKHLRSDKRFTKVGFVGHSEGSLVGSVAGPAAKFDAFVSLCGPGRKFADLLREQLKRSPKDLYEKCLPIIADLEAGKEVKDVPKELIALFRPSVQPYLASTFKPDPVKELAALACPVLVVSGSTDIQVKEDDYKLLAAARKGVKAVRVENMNHVLKQVTTTVPEMQGISYADPKQPLHPKVAGEVAGFFKEAFAGK